MRAMTNSDAFGWHFYYCFHPQRMISAWGLLVCDFASIMRLAVASDGVHLIVGAAARNSRRRVPIFDKGAGTKRGDPDPAARSRV